jgi:acyl-CoA thioester hydrolase
MFLPQGRQSHFRNQIMSHFEFKSLEPHLRKRAVFQHWTQDTVRFSDTDMMGHVNNTAYAAYCETGRVTFNRWLMPDFVGGHGMVARLAINYLGETKFPNILQIGTGVAHIGTTSFTLAQGLFVEDRCVATAEGVLVRINRDTRRPVALPDDMRAALQSALLTLA